MNRWQCRRQRVALVDYVDGSLDSEAAAKLESHLATCAACHDAVTALRRLPAELHETTLPDPGEEFWLRQRQAISRAVRNAPEPRSGPTAWLGKRVGQPRLVWRLPLAATASLLLALSFYRFGLTDKPAFRQGGSPSLSSLDDESLNELHDLISVVVPRNEPIGSGSHDEELLTSLPLSDLIGLSQGGGGGVASVDMDNPSSDQDLASDDLS
jgi:hypothetical protein